jgi:hypothetical protein
MTDKKRFARVADAVFRACGTLTKGFAAGCTTSPVAGLEVDVWLINRDDIDTDTTTITGRKITDLNLKAGKEAYKFTGKKTSNNTAINMNVGKYGNNWVHLLGMIIFDNTPDTKANIIEILADCDVVAVVRNKWKGTTSAHEFEVLGYSVGLTAATLEKKSDDADTQSAWKGILSSHPDQFEDNAGYILDYGTQALTLAALAAFTDTGS